MMVILKQGIFPARIKRSLITTASVICSSLLILIYMKASIDYKQEVLSQKEEMSNILGSIIGQFNQKKIEINLANQTSRRALVKLSCPSEFDPNRAYHRDDSFYRWMFVSDKLKLVVCAIPKVASSYFKRLVAKRDEKNMVQVQFSDETRPTLEKYDTGERRLRLRKYKKVIFVRHPLSRLWSAYTSKIVTARQGYFENIAKDIISRFRNKEVNISLECEPIVTFAEFTKFLIAQWKNGEVFDPHWAPYKSLCHPCLVRYNFIGRLESYEADMLQVNDFAKIPRGLRFSPSSVNSSLNGLLEAGCRLNMAPSCGTKQDIINANLHYLSVEGLVDLEEDTRWIEEKLALWLGGKSFKQVQELCIYVFRENFGQFSSKEASDLIKSRKRMVRSKAFLSIAPLEMNLLKEIYEEDFKLYGYEDL